MFRAYNAVEDVEFAETQIRYVSTCDIYVQAWAKIAERRRDNSEICSEACGWKDSLSSLDEKRKESARAAGIGGRGTSSRIFAHWLGEQNVSETNMPVARSIILTVTSSGSGRASNSYTTHFRDCMRVECTGQLLLTYPL